MTPRLLRGLAAGAALASVLAPRVAAACATCAMSAYGDRGFNWGYGGLLIAPFLVIVVVAAVLTWSAGYRLRWRRATPGRRPPTVTGSIPAHEETS
jgi:uncharacterized membrane protein